jgi:Flp pilus assembly protein TadG
MSVTMLLLIAVVGMAFDLGRVYISRNEAQVYTDAAALTAVAKLDGSLSSVKQARERVARLDGRWNLGTEKFQGVVVEFSTDAAHWTETPEKAPETTGWAYARVTAPSNDLGIIFLRAVGGPEKFRILGRSAARSNPVRLIE